MRLAEQWRWKLMNFFAVKVKTEACSRELLGDGFCLFRAVCRPMGMKDKETTYRHIGNKVAAEIAANLSYYEPFCVCGW